MEIVIFSFTKKASQLSTTLNHKLNKEAYEFITNLNCKNKNENNLIYNITSYTPKKYIINDTLTELPSSLQNTVQHFSKPKPVKSRSYSIS